VDDPPHCDFYFGSVVSRGALQIAISTAGESPAVAQQLRREIDEQLPDDLGPWLEDVGRLRREVLATHPRGEARRLLLHQLARRPLCDSEVCPSHQLARAPLDEKTAGSSAKVYLIGAGPGDPDLLTVKALRLLQSSDVVLHDGLVPQAILALASPLAEVVNVGKRCGVKSITQQEINALMIERAQSGALSCASRAAIRFCSAAPPRKWPHSPKPVWPLRLFRHHRSFCRGRCYRLLSHQPQQYVQCDLLHRPSRASATGESTTHAPLPQLEDATRVVYMPGRDLRLIAQQWLDEGLPPELPCAVVSRAAQAGQQIRTTTLAALGDAAPALAPSLLIAGWALRESSAAFTIQEQLVEKG